MAESALDLGSLAGGPSSVLVARATITSRPRWSGSWVRGPLPVLQPENETSQVRASRRTTDRAARESLVALQQARILYGGTELDRFCLPAAGTASIPSLLALEVLAGQECAHEGLSTECLVAVHVGTGAGPRATGAHMDRLALVVHARNDENSRFWAQVGALLPEGVELTVPPRVRVLTCCRAEQSVLSPLATAYAMVSATPVGRIADVERRSSLHAWTLQRTDWSALVLRDGAAFISHQQSAEPFEETLRVLVHSIHLDALMLATLQRTLIDRSSESAVAAPLTRPNALVELERRHFDFKRKFWRTSLTRKRSAPVDQVLRAFQHELLTEQDLKDVEDLVEDGARLANSLHAKAQAEAQNSLNRMVQTATVVFGAFGLSFTAAPVIADPSWSLFAIALVCGFVGATLGFVVLGLTGRRANADD